MITYECGTDKIETRTSICPVCGGRTRLKHSAVYWCPQCMVPLYGRVCPVCRSAAGRLSGDLRPVFPEERLLLEILLDKPYAFASDSVWNAGGGMYYVNGNKVRLSVGRLREADAGRIRRRYDELKGGNSYRSFSGFARKFVLANQERYGEIVSEACNYIRERAQGYGTEDMFVSFSGGKDSTVTSDLVMRALGNAKILHIFGDTTLEFPQTMDYVKRFRESHPGTPVISARNKDKNFEELCRLIGPPSRVMRWCCTIFKTGAIQRRINALFRGKKKILTFYGVRRSESSSRRKYDRESNSPKITKQVTVSPIIDWLDFDVWLYLLSSQLDFNEAYRLGYTRVGCWCCPNNSDWSEFLSRIHLPQQSQGFRDMLIEFAESVGKTDACAYVDGGCWKARQGGNGVAYAEKSIITKTPCALEENVLNFELQRPVDALFLELFKPFGHLDTRTGNARLGETYVLDAGGRMILKLQAREGTHKVRIVILRPRLMGARSLKAAEDKIKCQLTKYQMCMCCLACESVCRHSAVSVKETAGGYAEYRISDKKCVRCGECVSHYEGGCYMRKALSVRRGFSLSAGMDLQASSNSLREDVER